VQHLTDAVRAAVAQQNWHAALALSLALPDICGFLEKPGDGSQRRYVAWCNQHLVPRYTTSFGDAQPHVFLSGEDCYALRCAYLHEGADEIVRQRARKALDAFVFVAPPPDWTIHCNQSGAKLQLQVNIFCEDVCQGVDAWSTAVLSSNPQAQARLPELLTVHTFEGGFSF